MPSNLLNDKQCKAARCTGVGVVKLHDGEGLYLWVFPNGRKYWRLRYWQSKVERLLALGVFPAVSLAAARAKREAARQQLAAGLDPSTERKTAKRQMQLAAANSFEAIALEWLDKQSNRHSVRHIANIRRRLEVDAFPALGKRPIGEIDAPELLQAMRKIEARGAYDLAHRVLQVCGQIFRYGIATGRCTRNLSVDLKGALTPHTKKNQNAVTPAELPALLRAIDGYEAIGDRQTRIAMQLLALTFTRTNELIGAEWKEFDVNAKVWVVPAERMKMGAEHIVPLSRQTLALLEELKPLSGGSRFLLPGRNVAKPISNNTILFALYRLGYKGRQSGHGFRAIASTILNESGHFKPDVIERQLAHCERNAVRGAYNRAEYLPERKRMMQAWADFLEQTQRGGKVLPFRGTAA